MNSPVHALPRPQKVFKKHCDQDKYAINKEELILHDQVIVLTSYREDLTPGQLKAIHEYLAITARAYRLYI